MWGGRLFGSTVDHVRRQGAAALFRLASFILKAALKLLLRDTVSRNGARVLLSVARVAERSAALLLFGKWRLARSESRESGRLS
jgi:hypothetical protein